VSLYYLVANCTTINCPYFCFQNCNQCSNMFPNLTLVGVSRFHIQCMSLGHKYDSWLALPFPSQFSILNALAMSSSPVVHVPSMALSHLPLPTLLYISPFKNQTYVTMISKKKKKKKKKTRLSNRISDLPEEIHISLIFKPSIKL
jgi:hypothetical protein